jgi:hypothetical protein
MDKSGAAGKARELISKVIGPMDKNLRNCSPDADYPENANRPLSASAETGSVTKR